MTVSAGRSPERRGDLRESFGEVFAVPRIQNGFVAGLDSDGAIAVQLDFVGPVRAIREHGNPRALHGLEEFGYPPSQGRDFCFHLGRIRVSRHLVKWGGDANRRRPGQETRRRSNPGREAADRR
jgi:hypothetical protein